MILTVCCLIVWLIIQTLVEAVCRQNLAFTCRSGLSRIEPVVRGSNRQKTVPLLYLMSFDTHPVVEEASSLPWRPLDRVLAVRRLLWIIRRIVFILIYELSIGCRSQSVQSYAVAKSIFYFPVHTTDHTTKVSPVWFRTYTVSQSVYQVWVTRQNLSLSATAHDCKIGLFEVSPQTRPGRLKEPRFRARSILCTHCI